MKAISITRQGERGRVAEVLRLVDDWPEPAPPGPGEALLQTEFSALNHMDLWVATGVPGLDLEYPRVSGVDACARVLEVGEGADPAWVGRRVILNPAVAQPERDLAAAGPGVQAPAYELIGEHTHGAHRERFVAPLDNLAAVPDGIDGAQAAAFGTCMLTAWSMMVGKARLRPGEWVLITGIGGGVATSALAIARHFGCRTIVTSRHGWKLERARAELGADHAVLDEGEGFARAVRQITGKRGVDLAVDSAGRATHLACIRALARGGRYCTPGATSGAAATTDLARIFWNQLQILGSTMGSNEEFRQVAALFAAGHLRPVVDSVVGLEDAREAWRRLDAGDQMGKLVLRWTGEAR